MILITKHIDIEGPGTIEDYFEKQGYRLKIINLHKGQHLPENFKGIEAIIFLGGPMNVYEEDKFPFLKEEDGFLKRAIKKEVPLLGICLGSQLIAKACGVRVTKSPVKEVGWFKVRLQRGARNDPLFKGLAEEIDVFQWHEDTFDIPEEGVLLATSAGCSHQAFKIGRCAYGIQFHIEVTETIITDWCKAYFQSETREKQLKAKSMLETYRNKKNNFNKQSELVYRNFETMINSG